MKNEKSPNADKKTDDIVFALVSLINTSLHINFETLLQSIMRHHKNNSLLETGEKLNLGAVRTARINLEVMLAKSTSNDLTPGSSRPPLNMFQL